MELAQNRVYLQDFILTQLNLRFVIVERSRPSPSDKLLRLQGIS